VKFTWVDNSVTPKSGQSDYGILSSEIEKIAPELVHDSCDDSPDGDKFKTVAYDKIAPFLIEAVKELSNQISQLREEIDHMKK
jgi:hypothetical protein